MIVTSAAVAGAPFDEVAADYDAGFTNTRLGRLLRQRVWQELDRHAEQFGSGARVLELGCGTGEDAMWLARRGTSVVATDASAGMLAVASAKLLAARLEDRVELRRIDATAPLDADGVYDGVLANFGALNCVGNLHQLAARLSSSVRLGGVVVAVVMGPFCAWETAWYLLHANPRVAIRRAVSGGPARLRENTLPVWYPSPQRFARAFAPWFRLEQRPIGIGALLPPSYLASLVDRWPRLFETFAHIEGRLPLTAWWADHYLLALERR